MKKIICFAAAAALVMGLASCANNADSTTTTSSGTALSFASLSFADTTYATTASVTDEATAKTNAGKIGLWYDSNWCGSTVVPSNIVGSDSSLSFDYTVTGACTYGIQIFDAVSTDGTYLVTYTVKSAVAQSVTCNGTSYALEAGVAKEISALVTVSGATSVISIQVPVDATNIAASSTFTLSDAKYAVVDESKFTATAITLSSSTLSVAAGDTAALTVSGTYTMTDADAHVYTIYKSVAVADVTWTSDSDAVATVSAGTVTGVAAGDAVITVALGTVTASCNVTVSAAKDYAKYFSTTSTTTGASDSVSYPGYMCLWADNNWCGSAVTVSAATASATEYTITRAVTGSCWYGTQMFYAETAGSYTVSFTIKSSVAGDVTVNGTAYTLAADTEQDISFDKEITETADIIAIQLGKDGGTQLGDGTFTLSKLSITSK